MVAHTSRFKQDIQRAIIIYPSCDYDYSKQAEAGPV